MLIVSVVSGKGGSGKSLMTAALGRALAREGQRVLLVDLDIFVRGLTVLVSTSGFKKPESNDGSTISDLLGVYGEKSSEREPTVIRKSGYLRIRFFECDVLPAVENIGAPLDYDDDNLSNEDFCNTQIRQLIGALGEEYDYIIMDNRAGMDSLVAASCQNASIVLTVAEDDDVGRQTNTNLVRFLQARRHVRVPYTIINKARKIRTYSDLKSRRRTRSEFTVLGAIPFDIDILEEFGSERFWSSLFSTLYFRALIDVWNELAKTEHVRLLSENKYNFPPKIFMNPSQGRYSFAERMLRIYGFTFMTFSGLYWLYSQFEHGKMDMPELVAVGGLILGGVSIALSTSSFWSILRGRPFRDDDSYK